MKTIKQKLRTHLWRYYWIKCAAWLGGWAETDLANTADLRACYRLLLGRPPDPQGWRDWSRQIKHGRPIADLANAFLCSQERRNREIAQAQQRVETGEFSIWVDPRDPEIGRRIVQEGTYEAHVTNLIKRYLTGGMTFVDIGANIGWYTLVAAKQLGREGRVIAIEPNYRNLQFLYRNILSNQLDNVRVFPYAAGATHSLVQITSVVSNSVVTPITEGANFAECVPALPVDEVTLNAGPIGVIKMDVEGFEPHVLAGMRGTIARHHPVIFTEFHPQALRANGGCRPEEYLQQLRALGYALMIIEENGAVTAPKTDVEILAHWRTLNAQLDDINERPLDLLALPLDAGSTRTEPAGA